MTGEPSTPSSEEIPLEQILNKEEISAARLKSRRKNRKKVYPEEDLLSLHLEDITENNLWRSQFESKKKIGVEEDTSIIIKDKDFTEVDEDVLEFFCKSREEPYLRVFLASDSTESFAPPLGRLSAILPVADFNIENGIKDAEIIFEDIGRSMTPSLSTTSSLSTLSNHSVIREKASPESDNTISVSNNTHEMKNELAIGAPSHQKNICIHLLSVRTHQGEFT
ncbi:hypothetical protein JTB14_005074 [Gonioctena quinquepunctata]|nr:hypothetical protein JTB14_005074 [Gonioctena quinquepunctata]